MIEFEKIAAKNEEWLLKKHGKFSASQIFHIMVPGKGQMFSAGGLTYIEEVAIQAYTMFNTEDQVETWAMKNGKLRESESFSYLYKLLGFPGLQYHGGADPLFKDYCPDSGSSPDITAPLSDGTYSFGGELKNPTSKIHWKYLKEIKNEWDLKSLSLEYYSQVMFNIEVFKVDHWLWCSYNPYFPDKDKALIIEVKRNEKFLEELRIRLKMAVKLKRQLIEEMRNRN